MTYDELAEIINDPARPEWLKREDVLKLMQAEFTNQDIDKIQSLIDDAIESCEDIQSWSADEDDETYYEAMDASEKLNTAWHDLEKLKKQYGQ